MNLESIKQSQSPTIASKAASFGTQGLAGQFEDSLKSAGGAGFGTRGESGSVSSSTIMAMNQSQNLVNQLQLSSMINNGSDGVDSRLSMPSF